MIITEIQLHHWVRGNEREAQGIIPELIGRLVAASVRKPNDSRFPRADSIGQSGEDGYLDAETGFLPFVPDGKSFWEVGTGADPVAKANRDYATRTAATAAATRTESAIIVVTPLSAVHTWTTNAQKDWRTEKLDRKEWRDVRVIDGTRLIEWLTSFPAVERWLGIKMGLPAEAIEIPEERWLELSQIGSPPPLAASLFTANRSQACSKIDEVFQGNSALLKIDTHFTRHVADFVAAHVATMEDSFRDEIVGRCLIVTQHDAWRTLTSLRDRHVLIADFDIDDTDTAGMRLIERAKLQGHAVVFAGKAGGAPHPNRVSIPEPTTHQVVAALKEAGYNEERARTIAMKSTGSLTSLLRCLQNLSSIPEWAQTTEAAELCIAELLGAWNENVEGDREIAEELSGKAYGEWIGKIREVARRPAAPLKQKNGIWKFVSRYEGWEALGPFIFNDDLKRFQKVTVGIFRQKDPSLELAPEERYMATIRGKSSKYSSLLRTGLAETLALLGSRSDTVSNSTGRAESTARTTVYEILKAADWELWASLNDVLPLFAEAAPNEFLDAVERSLQTETFQAVFAQERGGVAGRTYMTGLLWALETLAWDSDYLVRVILLLGELAAIDPGGNWGNRPTNSLSTILLPWFPQTAATVEKRRAAVGALRSEQPEVAWNLILTLLPQMHQISSMTRKPAWRTMIPDDWSEGSTNKDYWEQIDSYSKLAVDAAKADLTKLQTLIDKMNSLTAEARDELLNHLRSAQVKALPQETRLPIWKELTDLIANHRRFQEADWTIKEPTLQTLSEIANVLAPTSPNHLHQRVFTARDFDLYETDNFEEEVRKLDARRRTAVEEVYAAGDLTAVLDFSQAVESSAHVGAAFAQFASAEDEKIVLPELLESNDPALARFAGGFVWSRFRVASWDWIDGLDTSKWTNSQKAQVLAYLPFASTTWHRATKLLGEDENLYWSKANANPFDSEAEISIAVDRLLDVGRVRESIFCMSRQVFRKQHVNPEQVIRALRAVAESYDQFGNMDVFEIVQIIKALQEDSTADPEAVASIEWSLLPLLDRLHGGYPKFLERRLANESSFFCEVIRTVFRSTKADADATPKTADQQAVATNAYRLLFQWQTPPGSRDDGSFEGAALKEWVAQVKTSCEESGHLVVALQRIGHVLRYYPPDPEGLWIHHSIAEVLNAKDASEIRKGFEIELFNSRGAHTVDPQGGPERELAKQYRKQAEEVELRGYARLAATLKEIAASYDREAEHNVVTAHIESQILQD
jgi:hypothetical protein